MGVQIEAELGSRRDVFILAGVRVPSSRPLRIISFPLWALTNDGTVSFLSRSSLRRKRKELRIEPTRNQRGDRTSRRALPPVLSTSTTNTEIIYRSLKNWPIDPVESPSLSIRIHPANRTNKMGRLIDALKWIVLCSILLFVFFNVSAVSSASLNKG